MIGISGCGGGGYHAGGGAGGIGTGYIGYAGTGCNDGCITDMYEKPREAAYFRKVNYWLFMKMVIIVHMTMVVVVVVMVIIVVVIMVMMMMMAYKNVESVKKG